MSGGFDFDSIFEGFFGGGQSSGRRRGPSRGSDLRYDLEITLEEAATGTSKHISIPRLETCPSCEGSGAESKSDIETCPTCSGSGMQRRTQRTPFGMFTTQGTCGKCRVKVQKGAEGLTPITEKELNHLSEEELTQSFRLACQTPLTQSMVILVPEKSRVGKQRLQTGGLEVPVKPSPLVKKYFVEMSPPTLHDPRSDEDRLLDALRNAHHLHNTTVDYEAAKNLSITLRKAKWRITVAIFKERIVAVEPGDTTDRCFGFAVDIGSTKRPNLHSQNPYNQYTTLQPLICPFLKNAHLISIFIIRAYGNVKISQRIQCPSSISE